MKKLKKVQISWESGDIYQKNENTSLKTTLQQRSVGSANVQVCSMYAFKNLMSTFILQELCLFCHFAETSKAMTAPAIWSAAVGLYIKI